MIRVLTIRACMIFALSGVLVAVTMRDAAASQSHSTVTANGTGSVEIRGDVEVEISARFPVLLVRDAAGDATIDGAGTATAEFMGYQAYFDAKDVHVGGTNVTVIMIGQDITVEGRGTGWAFVKGVGTYRTEQVRADWLDTGSVVALGRSEIDNVSSFNARGTGVIAMRGRLDYTASLGAGLLLVNDVGGGAQVDVDGASQAGTFLGFTLYIGVTNARISGSDVAVIAAGADLYAAAGGGGWGYVQGIGIFSTGAESSEPWTLEGRFAEISR